MKPIPGLDDIEDRINDLVMPEPCPFCTEYLEPKMVEVRGNGKSMDDITWVQMGCLACEARSPEWTTELTDKRGMDLINFAAEKWNSVATAIAAARTMTIQ